jgi:3-dehydroquinate synthase
LQPYYYNVRELNLSTPTGNSKILIGDCSTELKNVVQNALLVVSDRKVVDSDKRELFQKDNLFLIDAGEEIKSLATAEKIYAELYKRGATRSSTILAVGGGTITDLVGFVAATYLRGLDFYSAPTSLLAQVDASVGGKNGVNFLNTKNLIGTTRQAKVCFCDHGFLKTLSPKLIAEGYAEIIKHSLLAPCPLPLLLKNKSTPLDLVGIEEIIFETIKEKKRIVEIDELETGERRKLNLGHTIGHAIEADLKIPHGEAVSIGLVFEAAISVNRNLLSSSELDEIRALFKRYSLPVSIKFKPESIKLFMQKDKKRYGSSYAMPLLTGLGNSEIFEVTEDELFLTLDKLGSS